MELDKGPVAGNSSLFHLNTFCPACKEMASSDGKTQSHNPSLNAFFGFPVCDPHAPSAGT